MPDMHMRDKLRKVTEAAQKPDQVPEHSKIIGLRLFFICSFIGIFGLFAFACTLWFYGHPLGAVITLLIALSFLYMTVKLRSAEEIPKP